MLCFKNTTWCSRIENVSLKADAGECWFLLGKNGSGKSSFLTLAAGLCDAFTGDIKFKEEALQTQSLESLSEHRVFYTRSQMPEFDVPLNELYSLYGHKSELPRLIEQSFELESLLHKPLSQLSAGQQQRFFLSRTFLKAWHTIESGEALILLDEPCAFLDISFEAKFMQMVRKFCDLGNLVFIASHDINEASRYASHVAFVRDQTFLCQGEVNKVLNRENLAKTFDHRFFELNPSRINTGEFEPDKGTQQDPKATQIACESLKNTEAEFSGRPFFVAEKCQ